MTNITSQTGKISAGISPSPEPNSESFSKTISNIQPGNEGDITQLPRLPTLPNTIPRDVPRGVNLPDFVRGGTDAFRKITESAKEGARNFGSSSLEKRIDQALKTLEDHNLKGSFLAHVKDQLEKTGEIRIGVIDEFNKPNSTHGKNVMERIRATMPEYMKKYVKIIPFDVTGPNNEIGFKNAIAAAKNKDIVALSVSGGIDAINIENLETRMGVVDINASNRQKAFWTAIPGLEKISNNNTLDQTMMELSLASKRIPVVTPVWNNGYTTLPAILGAGKGGPIVTSIDEKYGNSSRTEAPGMVDFYAPVPAIKELRNEFTSQSPPYFIGQILGGLSKQDVEAAVSKFKR
jgi:hypothetical protein